MKWIKEYPLESKKKKQFAYSFAIIALDTKLYAEYVTMGSERDAQNKARIMLKELGLKIKSVRLDQYYSE